MSRASITTNILLSNSIPQGNPAGSRAGSAGATAEASRRDHIHPLVKITPPTPPVITAANIG